MLMFGFLPIEWIIKFFGIYYLTITVIVIIPSIFGSELGLRRFYIHLLMKVFKWSTATANKKNDSNEKLKISEDIISKENSINRLASLHDCCDNPHKKFELSDVMYLIKSGIEAVIDDEVTKRFRAEELSSWNLLTRTNVQYEFIRLFITTFAMVWLICTMVPLAYTKDSRENMPKPCGICVANHTTTLDAAILMQDRPYAILGQIHGGYLGWVMRMMSRATKHVWFERSEARDRKFVSQRIMDHVSDENNYPVLLFPEGTCINNTSVMMFKKGSFEIPTTIYPVAIKYNPWFGDAFWNSSKHSMLQYLLVVMTSWAIVADVWYLPAMEKEPNENAMQFAERVKSVIAKKGGLVDCVWDGQLKRIRVKESFLEEKRKELGVLFSPNDDSRTRLLDENGSGMSGVEEASSSTAAETDLNQPPEKPSVDTEAESIHFEPVTKDADKHQLSHSVANPETNDAAESIADSTSVTGLEQLAPKSENSSDSGDSAQFVFVNTTPNE